MTTEEKLDLLIERQGALHADLRAHIQIDEYQWQRVAETEDDIKDLTKDAAKISKKQAALLSTMSAGIATIASVVTKAFL